MPEITKTIEISGISTCLLDGSPAAQSQDLFFLSVPAVRQQVGDWHRDYFVSTRYAVIDYPADPPALNHCAEIHGAATKLYGKCNILGIN